MKKLICLLIVLGLTGSAWALPLKVDIPGGSTLDGTWSSWNPGLGPSSTTIDGIGLTFDTSHCDGGDDTPWWWWPYGETGGSGDALIEDGYYSESTSVGSPCFTTLEITAGLTNGVTYTLTNYHNISGAAGPGASASISGSGGASGGSAGGTGTVTVDAANFGASGTTTWTWTHDSGGGNAVIKVDYSGGRSEISGFILTPEPATVALLALGALLLRRRR